jgi:cell division protein FtsW (lipid II flippase)
MIRSAVAGNEVLLPLINRQIYFAIAGLVLIFVVAAIDYRYWMALYRPIVMLMSVLLLLFFSAQVVCAARWFSVGVLFLQPTEFTIAACCYPAISISSEPRAIARSSAPSRS